MKFYLRASLGLCLTLVLVSMNLDPVSGQSRIGRPGFPGGPPGGMPGGPGMPGGAIGRPGGVVGGPGIGGGVIGGPGMGGAPGANQKIWMCPKCHREVGRGTFPPAVVNCCGQTYLNGHGIHNGPIGPGAPAVPALPAPTPPGNPGAGFIPPPAAPLPPVMNPNVGESSFSAPVSSDVSPSQGGGMFIVLGIGVIVFGVLLIAGVVVVVLKSQSKAPARKRRRPRKEAEYPY